MSDVEELRRWLTVGAYPGVLRTEPLSSAPDRFGVPPRLASAVDYIHRYLPLGNESREKLASTFLEAISSNAPLALVWSNFVERLFKDPSHGLVRHIVHYPDLVRAMDDIINLTKTGTPDEFAGADASLFLLQKRTEALTSNRAGIKIAVRAALVILKFSATIDETKLMGMEGRRAVEDAISILVRLENVIPTIRGNPNGTVFADAQGAVFGTASLQWQAQILADLLRKEIASI